LSPDYNQTGISLVHLYSQNEDPFLSLPVTINFQNVFRDFVFQSSFKTLHSFLPTDDTAIDMAALTLNPTEIYSFTSQMFLPKVLTWWSQTAFLIGMLVGLFGALFVGVTVLCVKRLQKVQKVSYEPINGVE